MRALLPLIIAVTWLAVPLGAQQKLEPPSVYLVYPSVFDRGCNATVKTTIDPAAVAEATRRVPEFQAMWDREGPAYVSAVLNEVGAPFPYRDVQATLTVCPGVISMSAPLLLNVRRYLSTAAVRDPDWLFPETAFHELMHVYVRPIRNASSLRRKYASEDDVVLNHLHVIALEKLALLKLGRTAEWGRVQQDYRTVMPAAYKRALEIVTVEGHEAFVNELKASLPNRRATGR